MDVFTETEPLAGWRRDVRGAVLSIPGALASHRTAAALWGLEGFSPVGVEVVTERGTRPPRPAGPDVHDVTDLVPGDVDERDGIPCTSLVRTLVDLPAVADRLRCGQALDRALAADRLLLRRIHQRHIEVARPDRPGSASLRSLLAERGHSEGVAGAGFELQAQRLIAGSSLPPPKVRWRVHDGDFACCLDLAWPELQVAVECDSRSRHLSSAGFRWDRERRWQVHRLGWRVLEVSYEDVTRNGAAVLRHIEDHLAQRRRTRPL